MTKTKKLIERIRITGRMSERKQAHGYINKRGYTIVQDKCRNIPGTFKIDDTRFVIVAEREVKA